MSVFIRTDVTAVKLYEEYVLAGIGSGIHAYKKDTARYIEAHSNILEGQKIYGIVPNGNKLKLLIFGGKQFNIVRRSKLGTSLFDFSPGSIVCDDWLHSGVWLSEGNIALLTAHNVVQVWDVSNKPFLITRTVNKDNSILYSGLLLPLTDDVLVFSGTVFSEVIISRCKKETILHSLTGHKVLSQNYFNAHNKPHFLSENLFIEVEIISKRSCRITRQKIPNYEMNIFFKNCFKNFSCQQTTYLQGVIFSIACNLKREVIVTTSDDRSVRVWVLNGPDQNLSSSNYWDNVSISCAHELYGHMARVMRSSITDKYILSVGEDSAVCFWDCSGKMVRKVAVHQNAPVWSIDLDDKHFVTGGGDCGVTLHPLSIAFEYSCFNRVEMGINTPKKLVFTSRRNIIVLNESAELIYHDSVTNMETVHELKFKSTYIMMSLSPCRQIIAIADMNANLDVYVENCKGPAYIQNIIRTKLPINRVLSIHWADNRHLVLCSGSGEIYLIASKCDEVEVVAKFLLPHCKERWLTSATMSNYLLVIGDRCGNVHCYLKEDKNPNPMKTFTKVHGRYGPTSIKVKDDEIISTGRDGTLKYFSKAYINGTFIIKLIRSKEVGFQWVEKCIDPDGNIVCGFQERVFVVTDIRSSSKIVEVPCGGGHRSWDVIRYIEEVGDSYEEVVKLVYLKNSDINLETFHLHRILSTDIIKGTHSKEINCFKSYINKLDKSMVFFISGGEDTTLRVSSITKDVHFQDEIVLKQLSNVRTLKLCSLDDDKLLLVSGGGRAQICIRCITFKPDNDRVKAVVEDLVEFLIKGTDKERKGQKTWRDCTVDFDPETRIMDLEIMKVDKENFVIYTGCSDAYIRVFDLKYVHDEAVFKPAGQLTYHKTCILKTHSIEFLDQIILATCTTRGEICLWNITLNNSETNEPFLVFKTNKSGINCIASKVMSDEEILITTGGDDNAVHLNIIHVTNGDLGTAKATYNWSSDKFHCSQITGLVIAEDLLVTASIDQRVTILKIKDNGREITFVHQMICDIADVQGIDLVKKSSEILTVCVFGKGIQTLRLPVT